jgi:hypothetical protein
MHAEFGRTRGYNQEGYFIETFKALKGIPEIMLLNNYPLRVIVTGGKTPPPL